MSHPLPGYPQLDALRSHRSVRRFTSEPVTDEQLRAILTTAQRSSTSSNLQSNSVVAVRDPETKQALSQLCGRQQQIIDCPVFLAHCADLNRAWRICQSAGYDFEARFMEYFLLGVVDATIFAQTALSAAEAIGLGGCMIGGARNHPFEMARLLELPPRVFVVFGMTLGYPDWEKVPPHRPRLALDAVLHEERYDDSKWDSLHADYDVQMRETGIYGGRRINLAARVDGWTDRTAEGEYGWIEHSARRWIDPAAQRRELRPFLDSQQFGFE
ncbi:MAG: NADPH-dependent oxidoreductase [Candidatus Zixiibacteriota bacterium]